MISFVLRQPQAEADTSACGQGRTTGHPPLVDFRLAGALPRATLPSFYHFLPLTMADTATPTKPVKSLRHRGVTASVFLNKSDDGKTSFHKVSLQRSYKQGDEWKTTNSFGRDDLPIVSHLMQQAWEFILEEESKRGTDDESAA